MIRARVRALVDGAIERIMLKSRYRDPNYIRVNGQWLHVDQYIKTMTPDQED